MCRAKTNKLAVAIDKVNNACHCILDYRQMSARSFATYIQAEPALQPLFQQLSELGYMQKIFQESIPAVFAKLGQVGSFRDGTLTIVAKNGAAAAKLKQVVPGLEEKISQILRQPVSVKVNVSLDNSGEAIPSSRKDKPGMSAVALQSLQKLAADLPASALKDEVVTLLQRQGRRRIWDAD